MVEQETVEIAKTPESGDLYIGTPLSVPEPKMPAYLEQNQDIAEKEQYEPSNQYPEEEPIVQTSSVTKETEGVDTEPNMADEVEGLPWSKLDEGRKLQISTVPDSQTLFLFSTTSQY